MANDSGKKTNIIEQQAGDGTSQIGQVRDVIIYEGTKPISAGNLLDACQAQVESVLYDVRHKYDPKLYVNRAIEHDLNGSLSRKTGPCQAPGYCRR